MRLLCPSSNTVVIDAPNADTACENAIVTANDCDAWRSSDHSTSTFVDAIAEGDGVDPWSAHGAGSVLPIPQDHGETAVLFSPAAAAGQALARLLRGFVDATSIEGEITTTRQDWSILHRDAWALLSRLEPR